MRRSITSGFKAWQSTGGIGYEREVSQTIAAKMSGCEPTIMRKAVGANSSGIMCLTPNDSQSERIYGVEGVMPCIQANNGGGQNRSAILVRGFAQNSRNEVRFVGDDGTISGALAAEPGAKQTTYILKLKRIEDGIRNLNQSSRHQQDLLQTDCDVCRTVAASCHGAAPHLLKTFRIHKRLISNNKNKFANTMNETDIRNAFDAIVSDNGYDRAAFANDVADVLDGNRKYADFKSRPDYLAAIKKIVKVVVSAYRSQGGVVRSIVRRLTPVECGRLQGFDEGHLDCLTADSSKYKAAGNSFAVNCIRDVVCGIHRELERLTGRKTLKYGTISSGVEAHTMASAGFGDKAVFFSEIDKSPCDLLKTRYPDVVNFGDMTLVDYDPVRKCIHNRPYDGYVEPDEKALGFRPYKTPAPVEIPAEYGEVDLVCGGTPCQDMSVAGKRRGAKEGSSTRSALAFQLPRIGKALGSKFLIWENVFGAFSSHGGKDISWFLYRCMEAGYTLAWKTYDAQYTFTDKFPRAVPQRRRRIYMVAYRGDDWRVPCRVLFRRLKALGESSPDRVVGKGFYDVNPEFNPDEAEVIKTGKATRKVVPPPSDDLFSLFGGDQPTGNECLHDSDVAIDYPDEPDIRKIGTADLCSFCKENIGEVLYCGELFEPRKRIYKEMRVIEDADGRCSRAPADDKSGSAPAAPADGIDLKELSNRKDFSKTPVEGQPNTFDVSFVCGEDESDECCVDRLSWEMMGKLGNAGILSNGRIVTMNVPEWSAGLTAETLASMPKEKADLYDGNVCGLYDVLLPDELVDDKFTLTWRACFGVLKRAENRGKDLPSELEEALVDRIVEQAKYVRKSALQAKKEEDRLHAAECFGRFVAPALVDSDALRPGVDPKSPSEVTEDDIDKALSEHPIYSIFGKLDRPHEGEEADEPEDDETFEDGCGENEGE